jgi:hypothetical protein
MAGGRLEWQGEHCPALQVAASVLRIATQPKLLAGPLTLEQALQLVKGWIEHPLVEVLAPRGKALVDPGTAAAAGGHRRQSQQRCPPGRPALEQGCSVCSAGADFCRFQGLRLINPLT